jgi:hypothetical protein
MMEYWAFSQRVEKYHNPRDKPIVVYFFNGEVIMANVEIIDGDLFGPEAVDTETARWNKRLEARKVADTFVILDWRKPVPH